MARASWKLCSISGAQTPSASWVLVSLSSSNSLESYFAICELIVSDTPESRTASLPCTYLRVKKCGKYLFDEHLSIKFQIWSLKTNWIMQWGKFNSTSHWLCKQSEFFLCVTQYCKTVPKCHLTMAVNKQLSCFYSNNNRTRQYWPCWWWWRTWSRGSWGSCAPPRRWRWPSSWPGLGGGGRRAWGGLPCATSARPPSSTGPWWRATLTLASAIWPHINTLKSDSFLSIRNAENLNTDMHERYWVLYWGNRRCCDEEIRISAVAA